MSNVESEIGSIQIEIKTGELEERKNTDPLNPLQVETAVTIFEKDLKPLIYMVDGTDVKILGLYEGHIFSQEEQQDITNAVRHSKESKPLLEGYTVKDQLLRLGCPYSKKEEEILGKQGAFSIYDTYQKEEHYYYIMNFNINNFTLYTMAIIKKQDARPKFQGFKTIEIAEKNFVRMNEPDITNKHRNQTNEYDEVG